MSSLLEGYEDIFRNDMVDHAEEFASEIEAEHEVAVEAAQGKPDVELDDDDLDFIMGHRDSEGHLDDDENYEDDLTDGMESLFGSIATEGFLSGNKYKYTEKEINGLLKEYVQTFNGKYVDFGKNKKEVEDMMNDVKKSVTAKVVVVSGVPFCLSIDKKGFVKYVGNISIVKKETGMYRVGQHVPEWQFTGAMAKALERERKKSTDTGKPAEEGCKDKDACESYVSSDEEIAIEAEIAALEAELLSGSMTEPQGDGNPVEPEDSTEPTEDDMDMGEDGLESAINDLYQSLAEN